MKRPVLGAIAVVVHDDQVLLVRRKKNPDAGKWGFPGGHVEGGETALNAAARELVEETTVIATPLHYLTNIDVITYDVAGALEYHFLLAVVQCTYQSGTPAPSDEVSAAQWFPISQIKNLETSEHVKEMVDLTTA